jgi:hypothetical protein
VRPGIDGLRTWADAGQVVPWHERHNAAKCSMVHYPGQTALRGDLQLWDGEPSEHLNDLRRQIGDGRQLIEQPAGDVAARVDEDEGVLPTLGWIDERGPISTTDLLEPWASWLEEVGRSRNG